MSKPDLLSRAKQLIRPEAPTPVIDPFAVYYDPDYVPPVDSVTTTTIDAQTADRRAGRLSDAQIAGARLEIQLAKQRRAGS